MNDPVIWLAFSALLLAISLTALLVAAIPTLQELNRTARSADKLLDMLNRELPSTLESLRMTGREFTGVTGEVGESLESAKQVVQRVDRSLANAEKQLKQVQVGSLSAIAGFRAAWQVFFQPPEVSQSGQQRVAREINRKGDASLAATPLQTRVNGESASERNGTPASPEVSRLPQEAETGEGDRNDVHNDKTQSSTQISP